MRPHQVQKVRFVGQKGEHGFEGFLAGVEQRVLLIKPLPHASGTAKRRPVGRAAAARARCAVCAASETSGSEERITSMRGASTARTPFAGNEWYHYRACRAAVNNTLTAGAGPDKMNARGLCGPGQGGERICAS